MGYSPWGHKESDMTKGLTHTHTQLLQGALSAEGSSLYLSVWSPAVEVGSELPG